MRRSVGNRDYFEVVNNILLEEDIEELDSNEDTSSEVEMGDSDESDVDPMISFTPGYRGNVRRGERQRARHMDRMAMHANGNLNTGLIRVRPEVR